MKKSDISPTLRRQIPLRHLRHLGHLGQGGQGLTEYIALLLLIAVACFAATRGLGSIVKSKITEARNHINSDVSIQN